MANEKIELNISDKTKELVYREGKAANIYDPEKVVINGTITAPMDYWEVRKKEHVQTECYVLYSLEGLYVALTCEENEKFGTRVQGRLMINPELHSLRINEDLTYTPADLHKSLKFMRQFFKDQDKYGQLLNNLAKFKTSVSAQIDKQISDNRGNQKDNYEVTVSTDLALDFVLAMPLYKGGATTTFKTEICFEVRERHVELWLESVELKEAQYAQAKVAISELVVYFKEQGLVCIEV